MQTLLFVMQHILGQVQLEGLEKAAETSPLNGALVGFIIILLAGIVILWKQTDNGRKDLKELNKEYLKREEERNKQWSDSEKETLQVLNGVTSILAMSEKMDQKDTKEILEKLKLTEERIITAINNRD